MKKVCYNLDESNYRFEYENYIFIFSSEFYLQKFKNEYIQYIKDETVKLNYRFKTIVYADILLLFNLYRKIEKRGFKVYYRTDNSIYDIDEEHYCFNFDLDKQYSFKR